MHTLLNLIGKYLYILPWKSINYNYLKFGKLAIKHYICNFIVIFFGF